MEGFYFFDSTKQQKRQQEREKRKQAYDRVYSLHQQADFLCYINDAYMEEYKGKAYVKLEGLVAKGIGRIEDEYILYDCNGQSKGSLTMEELYLGSDSVQQLEGGDKRVALYPKEQNLNFRAGDILCILKKEI